MHFDGIVPVRLIASSSYQAAARFGSGSASKRSKPQ
jgi:hypothetical protein